MPDRTNATPRPAGILRPEALARHTELVRVAPSPHLTPWVAHHWMLSWDLPQDTTFPSSILPHPAANLSVEHGHPRDGVGADRVLVTGLVTRRFDVTLAGSGWVWGVRFRPGGLAALAGLHGPTLPAPKSLNDLTRPARDLLPPAVTEPMREITAGTAPHEAARVAEEALRSLLPDVDVAGGTGDPGYDRVCAMIAEMAADRDLLRVDDVAAHHDLSRRQVERLFADYVGIGPKWVLARYRMHDVVSALDDGHTGTLAELAASFGWYDQAHFTRDFTRLIGCTPRAYRDRG